MYKCKKKKKKKKKKSICTKDLNCFQDMSVEKDFEMSVTELVDYGYIIVCIYRSSNSNFWIFLLHDNAPVQRAVAVQEFLA